MNRIEPQLAAAVESFPQGEDFIIEPKYDGVRMIAQVAEDGVVKLWTRNWIDHSGDCPAICEELAILPANTWLDGELVGSTWGNTISGLAHQGAGLWYVAFDLMVLDGRDARSLSLRNRRQVLEAALGKLPKERVLLTPQAPATQMSHDAIVHLGYEGIVVKALDAPYASGKRGHGWVKIKTEVTMDAVITGYKPGKGSISGQIGALRFSQYKGDNLVERGAVGSGLTRASREWFTAHIDDLIEAQQVVEIKYNGFMPSGAPRNPRILRLRSDKNASDCLWDD